MRVSLRHIRQQLLYTTVLCGAAFCAAPALANPTGGSVAGGSAAISSSGSTLTVNQTSDRAIINWNTFDIGSGETTQFQQPSSSAIALNRISENKPSQIDGTLTANGNIILVNPNGVVFGAGSQVNVNSLVATTSDTDDTAFLGGGKITFNKPGSDNGSIVNEGQITAAQAGLVGLVAPQVQNSGVITAKLGQVALASGDTFTLDFNGNGLTNISVSGPMQQQIIQNSGTIKADGGTIQITAAAAGKLVHSLIINNGTVQADSVSQQNGRIVLYAANGTVTNSGAIYARGQNSGGNGGNVTIAANHVQQQGKIDVSGQQNGGHVNINFAQDYSDTPSSSIQANGVTGDGGTITLTGSSGSTLNASGTYEAMSQGGKGGTIQLLADAINLTGVTLNVNAATAGGQVTVGNATTQTIAIDSATKITADATQGTGGNITVQGNTVAVDGTASAEGAAQGGVINVNFDNSYTDTADAMLTVASSQGQGGEVYVTGGNDATLTVSGSYIADGNSDGGSIDMLTAQGNILLLGAYLSSRGGLGGGTIRIGGDFEGADDTERAKYTTLDKNTLILADATGDGNGGRVAVWSDEDTIYNGVISAEGGPNGGNGGYVETSSEQTLHIGDSGRVITLAADGSAGTWLLDPNDFIIAASGGDMTGAALTTDLASGNITIQSHSGANSGSGNIYVEDAVSWSANTLTLTAADNVIVSAAMTVTGSGALTINTATANGGDSAVSGGALQMVMASGSGFSGHIDYSSSDALTINGHTYTVITSLGASGSTTGTDLQGMNGNLSGYYALGANIDASATSGWNAGAGFNPIGNNSTQFTGQFEGLGHTVSNLTISRSSSTYVGLFGDVSSSATINDIGLSSDSVSGKNDVGGLVGYNWGTISNSYAGLTVNGSSLSNHVGGLVGYNNGAISDSYATGTVSGSASFVGGLVGTNGGTISLSYATGSVSGGSIVGGLVGNSNGGTISTSYATGAVSSGSDAGGLVADNSSTTISDSYSTGAVSGSGSVGGLVGSNSFGTYTNDFWDTQTSLQSTSAGGTGKTTAEMKSLSTFTTGGSSWNMDSSYNGSTATWYIIDGSAYPVLRNVGADMPIPTWTGTTSTAWNTASNWNVDAVPIATGSAIITNVSNEPILGSAVTLNNLTLDSGSTLDLAGYTLTATGTITATSATIKSTTGNLTLITDGLSLDSGSKLSGSGQLIIEPLHASDTIGVNGATGTLQITSTDLADIQSGFAGITIGGGAGYSGAIKVTDYSWNAPITYANGSGNVTVTNSSGAMTVGETLTTTGTGLLTLAAKTDITASHAITTTGGGGVTLDADTGGAGGAIIVNANITSDGGNITLGGGTGVISAGSGYAVGDATNKKGIFISNATVNAGGGIIVMNGTGYNAGSNNNPGILLNNTTVQTSGNGTITLSGIGGNGSFGDNYGVELNNDSTITGVNGTISITGTGGSSSSGGDDGVYMATGSNIIQTTGTGALNITGYGGGTGAGGYNYGVDIYGTVQSTVASGGSITITGYSGDNGGSGGSNAGVGLYGTFSSVDGSITINGNTGAVHSVSNDTGGYDIGIDMEYISGTGGIITATGNAAITDPCAISATL